MVGAFLPEFYQVQYTFLRHLPIITLYEFRAIKIVSQREVHMGES